MKSIRRLKQFRGSRALSRPLALFGLALAATSAISGTALAAPPCASGSYGLTNSVAITTSHAAMVAAGHMINCSVADMATAYNTDRKCAHAGDTLGHYVVSDIQCLPSPPHSGTCAAGWSSVTTVFAAGTAQYSSINFCAAYAATIGTCNSGNAASSTGNTSECTVGIMCAGGACGAVDLSNSSEICIVRGKTCLSPPPPPVVNGTCDNGTPLGCSDGNVISDNGQTACGTTRSWVCQGSGGGSNSGTCNYANPACPPAAVNGSCNNATPLGCTDGAAISDNGQTACGTTRSWVCQGANGGSDSGSCNYTNAACPTTGCGTAAGVSASSAPSSNLCSSGTASGVTQNGSLWEWTCTP